MLSHLLLIYKVSYIFKWIILVGELIKSFEKQQASNMKHSFIPTKYLSFTAMLGIKCIYKQDRENLSLVLSYLQLWKIWHMDSLMFNAGTLLQWYNCCAKILLSDFTLDFTHSAETQWYIQQQRRIQHKPNFQAIAANGHGLNALSGPFIPSALLPSCTIHVVIFTTQQRRVNLFFFLH